MNANTEGRAQAASAGERELPAKLCFFDDYWIDFRKGTTRRWFQPEAAASFRDPDFMATVYCSAAWCPEVGKYRLWYEASPDLANDAVRYLCLAESEDGVNFAPVDVNDHPERRMRRVVFDGGSGLHGSSVIRDPHDPDPSRRYKCATMINMGAHGNGESCPVILAFSPDGVHWTARPDLVAHPYTSDALNTLYYNPIQQDYGLLMRGGYVDRRIALRRSKDMQEWSEPQIILHPSPAYNSDAQEVQFYSMWAGWMDGVFLGLLWRYNTSMTDMDFTKLFGYMETELIYSYDGLHWMQTSGNLVVDRPLPPQYGCAQLSLMGMYETSAGDAYILHGFGAKFMHGTPENNRRLNDRLNGDSSATVFYRIRKDGYCGIEGLAEGSTIITKPLQFTAAELTVNVRAGAGYARFGMMRKDGSYFDGFAFDDCVPFEGDDCAAVPQWKERRLEELVGEQVRIAIELNGAILHAITLAARPDIVKPQASFGNPMQIDDAAAKTAYAKQQQDGTIPF
ncbi:hypothetical protein IDH44_24030 [Paenibacillus sp. IB182496]|uniref:Glycoside hydrolase family 32 protein n=1 Tax=Paenibacillus sabuli TaxID=2772509 RepID=A0A927BWQ5_9BACL|nr:hypothetical protein [Paenibacillus sabuli]MBD2848276.1 hypothetical protein [Paenibacillus sabuli]